MKFLSFCLTAIFCSQLFAEEACLIQKIKKADGLSIDVYLAHNGEAVAAIAMRDNKISSFVGVTPKLQKQAPTLNLIMRNAIHMQGVPTTDREWDGGDLTFGACTLNYFFNTYYGEYSVLNNYSDRVVRLDHNPEILKSKIVFQTCIEPLILSACIENDHRKTPIAVNENDEKANPNLEPSGVGVPDEWQPGDQVISQ